MFSTFYKKGKNIMNRSEKNEKVLELFGEYEGLKGKEEGKEIRDKIFLLYYDDIRNYTFKITQHITDQSLKEDLFQEACIKFLNAIENFEIIDKNTSFFSYALFYVKNTVQKYQNVIEGEIKNPKTNERIQKVRKYYENYFSKNKKVPTSKQAANYLGVREATAEKYIGLYLNQKISFDQQLSNDSNSCTLLEKIDSGQNIPKEYNEKVFKEKLVGEIKKLDPVKSYIIINYFGIDCESKTAKEISNDLSKFQIKKTEKGVSHMVYATLNQLKQNKDIQKLYEER